MKKWIMLIFKINKHLDELFDKLESRIHKLSLNTTVNTVTLYGRIIELNNKKSRLINLRVLYNVMADVLTDTELTFIKEICNQKRYFKEECAEKRGKVGELNRLIGVCKEAVIRAGFTGKRLDNEYSGLFMQKAFVA